MTTALTGDALTLAEWAKRLDPNGSTAAVIEMLTQRNDILSDITWMEGNLPTGHQTTIRTGLPDVYYRLINQGVAKSRSTTTQVTEGLGILEGRSEVDVDLAKLNGNEAALRASEAIPFMEAMNQKTAETLIYGNSATDPEQFNGLAIRYSSLSAANGENIISGGGSNSVNTSIYLVVWGPQTVTGIFPKGSEVGLKHTDLGIGDAFDSSSRRFRAYMDQYQWKAGLCVKDWQFCVRIANIDKTKLVTETTAADLLKLMSKAYHRIPSFSMGNAAWYMNRTVFQMLDIQAFSAVSTGGGITYDNVDGKLITKFRGIPIRIVDKIRLNETAVS